jgi:hypothetical protein
MEIERLHHSWEKWEDYKAGFYNNVSGKDKQGLIDSAVEMFSSAELTKINMSKVIKRWFFSCEQNLTNNGMNKIAYIGQAACCIYAGVPSTVTMEAWSSVSKENQTIANTIAEEVLKEWEVFHTTILKQRSVDNKC